ncbi:MAG: hypothetical protein ACR2M8_00900 [Pyrinomonadaceae bacterium]
MKYFSLLAFLTLFILPATSLAQKITVEEVLAKHLESIGVKQKRDNIKNQIASANVRFKLKGSVNAIDGKAVLVSSGNKNIWGMLLSSNDYPQDRFGFDGKDVRVGFVRPGTYSILGTFILSYKELLREGLLGGTLFSSWALNHTEAIKPKLSYDGTKKIDGNDTHVIDYNIRGGSDLSIKMYFETKTFRHVRTEYNRVIAARQGSTIDSSAGQSPDRYKLIEDFSDFQNVSGLTVPRKYTIFYSFSGSSSTRVANSPYRELELVFEITNFVTNQDIDPGSFDIDSK